MGAASDEVGQPNQKRNRVVFISETLPAATRKSQKINPDEVYDRDRFWGMMEAEANLFIVLYNRALAAEDQRDAEKAESAEAASVFRG